MVDLQAMERALRIGQKRDVTIYKFVCEDTIEERIYQRQIFKKYMAAKILSDPSRRRLFEKDTIFTLLTMPYSPAIANQSPSTTASNEKYADGGCNHVQAKFLESSNHENFGNQVDGPKRHSDIVKVA